MQGLIMMAMAPDATGAKLSKAYYQGKLKETAAYWSQCSNEGEAGSGSYTFCKCGPFISVERSVYFSPPGTFSHEQMSAFDTATGIGISRWPTRTLPSNV